MIKVEDKTLCAGCGACVQSCPVNCISLQMDEEGFFYPSIDMKRCTNCGKCERVCPCIRSLDNTENQVTDVWCAKNQDERIRSESSSGGVFSALAEYIIGQKGIVFGVAMSDDCKSAEHIAIESLGDIKKLRGSKYLQSIIGNSYSLTKKYLEEGRKVLFSGTPCQIKGLKLYLNKDFDNLICVDVICHGVPSQKLWKKYIEYLEQKRNVSFDRINFRSKKYGWRDFGVKYSIKGGRRYFKFNFEDPYFQMFNNNFCLRPSCYQCNSKDGKSGADITLGDFWQVERVYPRIDDNRGLSMVLIRSNKGRKLLEEVKEKILIVNEGLDYEMAKKCNPAIFKSQPHDAARDMFYADMNKMSFRQLSKKYTPQTVKIAVKSVLIKYGLWPFIKRIRGKSK